MQMGKDQNIVRSLGVLKDASAELFVLGEDRWESIILTVVSGAANTVVIINDDTCEM